MEKGKRNEIDLMQKQKVKINSQNRLRVINNENGKRRHPF